ARAARRAEAQGLSPACEGVQRPRRLGVMRPAPRVVHLHRVRLIGSARRTRHLFLSWCDWIAGRFRFRLETCRVETDGEIILCLQSAAGPPSAYSLQVIRSTN